MKIEIRQATMQDLDAVAAIEAAAFPPAEAASKERFRGRMEVYGSHFFLLWVGDKAVGVVDGMVTDSPTIHDDMFEDPTLHNEKGQWAAVFGLAVLPAYRRHGYAAKLMQKFISQAREQGRRGCILTCKQRLIPYYEKFGYVNQGVSRSVHGGATWFDMTLTF